MMLHLRLLLPIGALLVALGAIAAACGGGELSLEEYFQRVDQAGDEFDTRIEGLEDAFPEAFEEPTVTRDFFTAAVPIFRDFIDGLAAIDPPAAVEDEHNERVAAGEAFEERVGDLVNRLADVESASELEDLFDELEEDPEFTAAEERFEAACLSLQGIADANGVGVDLECEDEEESEE